MNESLNEDNGNVKIFDNPYGVLAFLNEHYSKKNPILVSGFVSLTNESIEIKFNYLELFSNIFKQDIAKPIGEFIKTGFDDWIDASYINPEVQGIEGKFDLSFLNHFYSNFPSRKVERKIKQLNGANPAIAVYKSDLIEKDNFSYRISHNNHPKALDYLLVMKTGK